MKYILTQKVTKYNCHMPVRAKLTVGPHVLIDYDKTIALSNPIQLTIRIQSLK